MERCQRDLVVGYLQRCSLFRPWRRMAVRMFSGGHFSRRIARRGTSMLALVMVCGCGDVLADRAAAEEWVTPPLDPKCWSKEPVDLLGDGVYAPSGETNVYHCVVASVSFQDDETVLELSCPDHEDGGGEYRFIGVQAIDVPVGSEITYEQLGNCDMDCIMGERLWYGDLVLAQKESGQGPGHSITDEPFESVALDDACRVASVESWCDCDMAIEMGVDIGGTVLRTGERALSADGKYLINVAIATRFIRNEEDETWMAIEADYRVEQIRVEP